MSRFLKKILRLGKDSPDEVDSEHSDVKYTPEINARDGPEFECEWSTDEAGQQLSSLWDGFISTYEQPNLEDKFVAFTSFSERFVEVYSSVIDISSNQISTNSSKVPTCVEDTEGHPSVVIVQVTCLLVELLIKADDNLDDFDDTSASSFQKQRIKKTEGLISSDTFQVAGIKFAFENEKDSRSKVTVETDSCNLGTAAGRRGLLLLLHTLSILVHWEHNRIIFQSRIGSTFATNFIGLIRFLIHQLDGLTLSWISVKDNAIDSDHPVLSDLREETSFVFSALVLISQFIAKSCPAIVDISHKTACGFLPPQPWRTEELQVFGYASFLDKEDKDEEHELQRSRFDSTDDSMLNTAPIANAFCSSTQPLLSNFRKDAWCGILIAAGADYVIIDVVRKLSALSKMLAIPPAPSRTVSDDKSAEAKGEDKRVGLTSEEKWTITAYDIWKKCIVLQNEVLFALIGFVATHPVATSNRFLVCEGAQALNIMLLDSKTFDSRQNPITNALVFRRGVLCLRVNELVMQHYTTSDICDIFFPESLGWFLSWMRSTYNFEKENVVLNDDDFLDNVVGCVEVSGQEDPPCDTDLWPWASAPVELDPPSEQQRQRQKRILIQKEFTPQNYRLCHQVESGTRQKQSWGDKVTLEKWADYSESALRDRSEGTGHFDLPWFLRGRSARAWHVVFSSLLFTTYADDAAPKVDKKTSSSSSSGGRDANVKGARSNESFELIVSAVFSCLEEIVSGEEECLPLFQMHVLLFMARCLHRRPVDVIEYFCEKEEIWKQLFGQHMFLGGRAAVVKLCDTWTKKKTNCCTRSEMEGGQKTSEECCLAEPLFSFATVEGPMGEETSQKTLTNSDFSQAFMWFYLHDSILDLTTLLTRTANSPPTDRHVSTKKGFEIKPIIQALQMSSEKGYDDVTFQLVKWMGWYLQLSETMSINTRSFLGSHFFRASLAVCGYQLSDIGAYSILQKSSCESPLVVKERTRLFMQASRKASISLVNYILELPGCDKWLSLFLSKERKDESPTSVKKDSKADGSQSPSSSTRKGDSSHALPPSPSFRKTKTPAQQTLVVLLLDQRLRPVLVSTIMKIVSRLMQEVTTEESSCGFTCEDEARKKGFGQRSSALSHVDNDKALQTAAFGHNQQCSQAITDIFSDLFEHVKCASRQPEWFYGGEAVSTILGGITYSLRSLRHSPEAMGIYQSFFRRGRIIRELVCNTISCIHYAKDSPFWEIERKSQIVNHCLTCLTAIMIHDGSNKACFKSIMMAQLSRRGSAGKSESTQLQSSREAGGVDSGNSIVIRYDEFTGMILEAQEEPHFDTILVLFEMILDSQIYNSKAISEQYSIDHLSVSDGLFSDEFDRPQICNVSAIPLIFGVLPRCRKEVQVCVLNSFHSLVVGRNSLINVSTCTSQMQPSLLDHLLDLFPLLCEDVQECAVNLLQTLGRHSISVAQLKKLFQMMQSKGDYRPVHTSLLVRSLQGMIDNEDAPRHSFVFSGNNSGLEIPSIPRWPAANAFTFSVWLRVESPLYNSFLRPSDGSVTRSHQLPGGGALATEYRPYILSLRAANGSGLEISLKKHSSNRSHKFRICVRCFDGKGGEPDTLMLPGKYIIEGKWHYLAVSHRSSSGFGKRNEIEIMLDDKFVRQKFSFPNFGDMIQNPLIGACDERFKGKDADFNTTMRGQMSAVYLFADALTEGQLRGIRALGPSYFYSFEPYDTVRRDIPQNTTDKKITVDPVLSVLDSSLTSLIALAYNPAVWKNDLYLDNTPEKNGVKWKTGNFLASTGTFAQYGGAKNSHDFSKIDAPYYSPGRMHARGLPGTYRDTTSDVRIALNSLGGIKALLPLFAQFDQPRFKPSPSRWGRGASGDHSEEEVNKTLDSRICVVVLELLRTLLVESSENEILLRDVQATSLISYFLVRMSPQHMSLEALNIILLIHQRVAWCDAFPPMVVEHILLNFKLWVFTPFEVQSRLMEALGDILLSIDLRFLRDVGVVKLLLNTLYLLYGYTKPNLQNIDLSAPSSEDAVKQQRRSSYSTSTQSKQFLEAVYVAEKWVNSGTGEVMGEKLEGEKLQFIRQKIVSLIEKLIRRGDEGGVISSRDVSDVILHITSTEPPRGKVEILDVLHSLLASPASGNVEKNAARVLAGCALDRGLLSLLPLCSDENMAVRLRTLLIVCTALTQAVVHDSIFDELSEDTFVLVDNSLEVDKKTDRLSMAPLHFFKHSSSSNSIIDEGNTSPKEPVGMDDIMDFPESDTLNALGLPVPSLIGVMLWFQEVMLEGTGMEGGEESEALSIFQAKFVAQAMLCSFIGEPCTYLIDELRALPIEDSRSVASHVMAAVNSRTLFFEALDFSNAVGKSVSSVPVCIPMMLPALLNIVKNVNISLSLRLSAMVGLRTIILQCDDNTDHILRMAAWQDYFLQLIFELRDHKTVILAPDPDNEINLEKYEALVDASVSTLIDIQVTAVRIGLCLGQSCVVSPTKRDERLQLTPEQIFNETKSGERHVGVCVIRETMVLLKERAQKCSDDGELARTIGFTLLQNVANALRSHYELAFPSLENLCRRVDFNSGKSDQMKIYAYHILHLDQWLFGTIVMDFLDIHDAIRLDSGQLAHEGGVHLEFISGDKPWSLILSMCKLMEFNRMPTMSPSSVDKYDKTIHALAAGTNASWLSNKVVVERSVSGSVSLLMHSLCYFLQLNIGDEILESVLSQFNDLLTTCQEQSYNNLEYECAGVFARILLLLQSSSLPLSSAWVQGVMALLIHCMDESMSVLLLLIDATIVDQRPNGDFLTLLTSTIPSHLVPVSVRQLLFPGALKSGSMLQNITLGPGSSVDVSVLLAAYAPDATVADATLDIVKQYLGLRNVNNFTWEYLLALAVPIMEETARVSAEARSDQFEGIEMHKSAADVNLQSEHQRVVRGSIFDEVSSNIHDSSICCKKKHHQTIEQHFRCTHNSDHRVLAKWNTVISSLANERGPWGYGSSLDVFWTMDRAETNSRMHHVMQRNEDGTRHQMATLLASTKGKRMVQEDLKEGVKEVSGRGPDEEDFAVLSSQNLWKDITKYHKSTPGATDELNQDYEDDAPEGMPVDELLDPNPMVVAVDTGKVLFRAHVEIITAATNSSGGVTTGSLEVTKSKIIFTRSNENDNFDFVNKTKNPEFMWACQRFPSCTWSTMEIQNVYHRHYQQRNCGLELFFTSRQAVFMVFADKPTARQLYTTVRRQIKPPFIVPHYGHKPVSIMSRAMHTDSFRTVTQAWVYREISNYDYLMFCNTVAGRSYNDLSQYPIFPWVISNYSTPKLNLNDPKSFRDLKWPMGAQNENQRDVFQRRYDDLADSYYTDLEMAKRSGESMSSDSLPPFHYGSHYSTMGFVLWYLVRYEPFTSLNIWMQDGRFDKTDRIFDTLEMCYKGVTSNQSDVKELIPEFFYCPEFLQNPNNVDLGTTQGTPPKKLGDVGLPPWAKTAKEFVRLNRMALESEYVSANMHHWIDLIFGFKQRPPHMGGSSEAVDACNVYFHLTYNGAVDLDKLRENDTMLYDQIIRQVSNFGQTPALLFRKPHPQRLPINQVDMFWPLASVVLGADTIPKGAPLPERPRRVVCFKEHQVSEWPIVLIGEITSHDKLITLDTSRIIGSHFWQVKPPDVVPPFQIKTDQAALRSSQGIAENSTLNRLTKSGSSSKEKRIGVPFAPHQLLRSDFIYDLSGHDVKLHRGNKALFEKEEANRSNWRVRPSRPSSSRLSSPGSQAKNLNATPAAPSPNTNSAPAPSRQGSMFSSSSRKGSGYESDITLQRVDEHISNHLFALLSEYRILFSCGHWDYSIKASSVETGRLLQSVSYHKDVVTCMGLATDFGNTWLVTGSRDCTVIIWAISPTLELPIVPSPLHLLYGHDDAVNCVSVSPELDIVISGSDDGTIIVHKLRGGVYIRSISLGNIPPAMSRSGAAGGDRGADLSTSRGSFPSSSTAASPLMISKCRIHYVGISHEGYFLAYSNDDMALYTFTVNGEFVSRKVAGERLHVFQLSEDNKVLITGGERALLVMRWVHSLELSNVGSKWEFDAVLDGSNAEEEQEPFNSPIRSLCLTKKERHLIVGLESGELRILAQDSDYLRKRLHSKLMEIGILEKIDVSTV